ncbi:MAG TPA: hypothetical protein VGH27_24565 [Streptosporangiaceae bacterium]|jgi:hypothetical protein
MAVMVVAVEVSGRFLNVRESFAWIVPVKVPDGASGALDKLPRH